MFRIAKEMESADKSMIDLFKEDPLSSTVSRGPSLIQHTVPSKSEPPGNAPCSTAVNNLNDMARSSLRRPAFIAEVGTNQLFVSFELSSATEVARRVILSRCAPESIV